LLTSDFHHCTASACFIPVVFFWTKTVPNEIGNRLPYTL
jgi:hypothetical protein